jgi:16S rRNA (uracil1498-N3)-methyltransferase
MWEQPVRAAAKQARRARVPVVAPLASGADVQARVAAAELAVLLHEEADRPLAGLTLPAAGDVVLVVGPEGGIGPEEVSGLVAAGAVACRLGPHVLRSSTAGPAALAVLSAGTRWR